MLHAMWLGEITIRHRHAVRQLSSSAPYSVLVEATEKLQSTSLKLSNEEGRMG